MLLLAVVLLCSAAEEGRPGRSPGALFARARGPASGYCCGVLRVWGGRGASLLAEGPALGLG